MMDVVLPIKTFFRKCSVQIERKMECSIHIDTSKYQKVGQKVDQKENVQK